MQIENENKIVEILENGGVIAYVTDTVWGLGCLPTNEKAVRKIYEIKKQTDHFYNHYRWSCDKVRAYCIALQAIRGGITK